MQSSRREPRRTRRRRGWALAPKASAMASDGQRFLLPGGLPRWDPCPPSGRSCPPCSTPENKAGSGFSPRESPHSTAIPTPDPQVGRGQTGSVFTIQLTHHRVHSVPGHRILLAALSPLWAPEFPPPEWCPCPIRCRNSAGCIPFPFCGFLGPTE